MKITPKFRKKITQLLVDQRGVLSSADLWTIITPTSKVDFYRQLKKLCSEELVFKVARGYYVGEEFSKEALVMAMKPESYLSLEYVLAFYNLIGTYVACKIRPITTASGTNICSDKIIIEYKQISKNLCFAIEVNNGIRMATKEKAFLDTLYFYQKGTKFNFDIYSDINTGELDRNVIFDYLKRYGNPKFVKFVKDYFND